MTDWTDRWREVADGVLVRRHRVLDLNISVVVGDDRCLLVDTHAHAGHATALLAAVRALTALPLVVVNTHAHFDHCFGNATILDAEPDTPVWGHVRCRTDLLTTGAGQRKATAAWMSEGADVTPGRLAEAQAVLDVRIEPPRLTFTDRHTLDLGGRTVELVHPGLGHTDHDTVVHTGSVTIAGDLVEEGGAPAFEDAFPRAWPRTLRTLLPTLAPVVVPGHGDVVDRGYVEEQAAALAHVAAVAADLPGDVDDDRLLAEAVRLPVGRHAGLVALRRDLYLRGQHPPDQPPDPSTEVTDPPAGP